MYLLHGAPKAQRLQTLLQRVIDMPEAETGMGVGLVWRWWGHIHSGAALNAALNPNRLLVLESTYPVSDGHQEDGGVT